MAAYQGDGKDQPGKIFYKFLFSDEEPIKEMDLIERSAGGHSTNI
jgi:hypothetical protein